MLTRRKLITAAAAGTAVRGHAAEAPALAGGKPVRTAPFPSWPVFDRHEEQALLETLHSRKWLRIAGEKVNSFERMWAAAIGTKGCVATCNGTSALFLSLKALEVGPGDEVIVPPYTFIATVNAVLLLYALPVFVDTDPATGLIDAGKIEAAITGRTAAILPVHIGGSAADMDTILAVAGRRSIPVVEDVCQAHFGEWRGRRLGGWGTTGCFSFQSTKNLACGEGGALVSNDEALVEKCFSIHSHGRPREVSGYNFAYRGAGANLRMDEFRAAVAAVQLTRLEQQVELRDRNARYLTSMLTQIPGIEPLRMYPGCTRNAWHLYMFRYRPEEFAGLPRRTFVRALMAEGIPAAIGYTPLNREPFLKNTLASRHFQAIYSRERLAQWEERNRCPRNDRFCEETVWLTQNKLLGTRSDMEQIAEAMRKVRTHAARLLKV